VAKSDLAAADAQIVQAQSSLQQAIDELDTKVELNRRGADIVAAARSSGWRTSWRGGAARSTR